MHTMIELICESCGNKFLRKLTAHNTNLKRGSRSFCSNSCKYKETKGQIWSIERWKQNGGKPKDKKDKYSQFRKILAHIKPHESNRGRKENVDIDLEYLYELWEKQKGICPITKIQMIPKYIKTRGQANPYQISIDRIDNSLPYRKGNIRLVCYMVNLCKNIFTDEQMIEFCKIVAANN